MIGYHWIAMLDILGFRQMVKTRDLHWLVQQVNHLFAAAEPHEVSFMSLLDDGRKREGSFTLGHLHFSDTIMLWTPPLNTDDSEFNTHAFSLRLRTPLTRFARGVRY
jgi:hypothetical protein